MKSLATPTKQINKNTNEQFTVCTRCGTLFEQEFRASSGKYSLYRTCTNCRPQRKISVNKQIVSNIAKIDYNPYPWQQQFHRDMRSKRMAVLACGARCGKDRATNMQFIDDWADLLSENRHLDKKHLVPSVLGWIVAPNERMAKQNWREFKAFFPKQWIKNISESTMTIETIGGGIIEVRSAYDPESLVGVGLDICIITEAARISDLASVVSNIEDRLHSPERGIGGKGGRFIVNSSPRGRGYFYEMFCWGQKNHPKYDSNWVSYQLPTTENPDMKKVYDQKVMTKTGEYITYGESLRRRKGRKFLEDNMAQFLEAHGTVFQDFRNRCVIDLYATDNTSTFEEIKEQVTNLQAPKLGGRYRLGYDPASGEGEDCPTIVIREEATNNIVRAIDLYGYVGDDQLDRVAYWAKYYNDAEICLLYLGNYLAAGQLRKRGCRVTEIGEQGQKKRNLVLALQTAAQNDDVHVIADGSEAMETLVFQMDDYTDKGNKLTNVSEEHDDFVSALYAVYYDYNEIPTIRKHYMPKMGGIKRSRRRVG